jgi:uncharacterized protein (TIGR00730 family)
MLCDAGSFMQSVCVFCGSSGNARAEYFDAARETGVALARRGLLLVYGGARVGLMGALAGAALAAGGRVTGVIPRTLVEKEVAHSGLTDLRVVESMHDRKALMNELSDAFVALPGGFGTLDELFETLTWGQLGFHAKPCGLLNIRGYYAPLLALCDRAVEDGFLHPAHRRTLLCDTGVEALLEQMESFQPAQAGKWWVRS